jgi:hypothetical protein
MRLQHKQQLPPCQSQSVAIMNGIMQWGRRLFCKEIWSSNPLAFSVIISCWCISYQGDDDWMGFYSEVGLRILLKFHCNLFLCLLCLFFIWTMGTLVHLAACTCSWVQAIYPPATPLDQYTAVTQRFSYNFLLLAIEVNKGTHQFPWHMSLTVH